MQKLVLTSSASEEIKTFNICNSLDFESIITKLGEKFFSGAFHFSKQNSIVFTLVEADTLLEIILPLVKNEENTNDHDRGSIPNSISIQSENLQRQFV